jgi:hypothetical protein
MDGRGYLITIWLLYVTSIGLTFFLARTLFRNGAVFLQSLFHGNPELARAVNVLLVVSTCSTWGTRRCWSARTR